MINGSDIIFEGVDTARAINLASNLNVVVDEMEWNGDALQIYFAHSKTDQTGREALHPRHIFANPLHPQICPIVGLAVFLLCYPRSENSKDLKLFQGSDQYQRRALDHPSVGALALPGVHALQPPYRYITTY